MTSKLGCVNFICTIVYSLINTWLYCNSVMKLWIEIWYTQKRTGRIIIWNGTGKKIVSHSKLKFWTFFWGHGDLYLFPFSTPISYKPTWCTLPFIQIFLVFWKADDQCYKTLLYLSYHVTQKLPRTVFRSREKFKEILIS